MFVDKLVGKVKPNKWQYKIVLIVFRLLFRITVLLPLRSCSMKLLLRLSLI